MQVKLAEDARVLIPNSVHQNFTETEEIIHKDTILNGEPKVIRGLRRGEPFDYKLFLTENNKLIHLKKTRNMDATEVKLGADSSKTPTVVNLKQTVLAKPAIIGAISGAVIGFGYAKYKKHETKKIGIYTLVGAVAGYVIGRVIAHTGSVKTGK